MKQKIYIFLIACLMVTTVLSSKAQDVPTNFETGFAAGQPQGNWVSLGGNDFIFKVENDQLKISYTRSEWHLIQLWMGKFDIISNPFIKFKIKSDKALTLSVLIKYNDTENASLDIALKGNNEWQDVLLNYSSKISAIKNPIQEIQFTLPYLALPTTETGTIFIDDLKIGKSAVPEVIADATGLTETFNSALMNSGLKATSFYRLTQSSGALKIECGKQNAWEGFEFALGKIIDVSSNPFINIKLKAEKPLVLSAYFVDNKGKNYNKEVRIYPSDTYNEVCINLSDAKDINLTAVTKLIFAFNGAALTYNGTVWFDEISIGSDAKKKANIGSVPNQLYYVNSGKKTILLTDLQNVASFETSGGSILVKNIQFSDIKEGYAQMSLDQINDAIGSDSMSLTAKGANGFADNKIKFKITITNNNPPSINAIDNQELVINMQKSIKLTGINDGDPSFMQKISLLAVSDNPTVLPSENIKIDYRSDEPYGVINLKSIAAGIVKITLTIKDDGSSNNTKSIDFEIKSYKSYNNKPTIASLSKMEIFNEAIEHTINLINISDGDDGKQNLTFEVSSSDQNIIPTPKIEYTGGDKAILKFTPNSAAIGTSTISITLKDNGGNAENNGNMQTSIIFDIETRIKPLLGYVYQMSNYEGDRNKGMWGPEQENVIMKIAYENLQSSNCLKVECINKWTYGGIWSNIPEMDLTDYPYISMDIYSVDHDLFSWLYFYDTDDKRNTAMTGNQTKVIPANKWTTVTFDFSGVNGMADDNGKSINTKRIKAVLYNFHGEQPGWPFTNYSGTFYYKNIRIGNEAVNIPNKKPVCTFENIADRVHFTDAGPQTITITGLSNGKGEVSKVKISAQSVNPEFIANPTVNAVNSDGTANLVYIPKTTAGEVEIRVTASAEGSLPKVTSFKIKVIAKDPAKSAKINIDLSKTYQTIKGFGSYMSGWGTIDYFANDLGSSCVRIGVIGNQIEPVNDNNNPNVLDFNALDKKAFDFEYFKSLKERGVETFILTVWSPPAWMKKNLSEDFMMAQAIDWDNTDNRLETYYFDEYAEYIFAIIKLFQQEAAITLDAIGLQNEPAFNEPYPSAILSPVQFVQLIKIVGNRLKKEGLTTKFYMPEQVYGQGFQSMADYMKALKADPESDKLTDIIAIHGYGEDGIKPGAPDYASWTNLWNQTQALGTPKEFWMTETERPSENWDDGMSMAGAIHGALVYGNIGLWSTWAFDGRHISKGKPTPIYYSSKNYYKFIRPGAVRIDATSTNEDILVSAFKKDNNISVVLINKGNSEVSIELNGNSIPEKYKAFISSENLKCEEQTNVAAKSLILPPYSVTTLISSNSFKPTIDQVVDKTIILDEGVQTIQLSGITDGGEGNQIISVSATNSDNTIISEPIVSYISPNQTGTITLTPLAYGKSEITVTVKDNGSSYNMISMSYNVNVISGINNPPTLSGNANIKIFENSGETSIMLENISDGDNGKQNLTISAITDNNQVVSAINLGQINNGSASLKFTSGKAGKAVILVTITDDGGNPTNNGNQSAIFPITVEVLFVNKAPTIDPIKDANPLTTLSGKKSIEFKGISDGDEGSEQKITVTAQSSNPDVVDVQVFYTYPNVNGTVILNPKGVAGNVIITVKVKDDGGTENSGMDSKEITFKVIVNESTPIGISEKSNDSDIMVYPNPANTFIIFKSFTADDYQVELIDMTGRLLLTKYLKSHQKLDIRNFKKGLYLIKIKNHSYDWTKKLIIK